MLGIDIHGEENLGQLELHHQELDSEDSLKRKTKEA